MTAKKHNISGKELTPFLISEINKESNNLTLKANVSLIINNADLAGKLSKEYYYNQTELEGYQKKLLDINHLKRKYGGTIESIVGYKKELEINGVGYRAKLEGSTLVLSAGFSHPVRYKLPEGVKAVLGAKNTVKEFKPYL